MYFMQRAMSDYNSQTFILVWICSYVSEVWAQILWELGHTIHISAKGKLKHIIFTE